MSSSLRIGLIACSLSLSACLFFEDPSRNMTGDGPDASGDVDAGRGPDVGEPDVGCVEEALDPAMLCALAELECGVVFYEGSCGDVEIDCDEFGPGCGEGEQCNAENRCECAAEPSLPPEQLCEASAAQCGELKLTGACGEDLVVTCGACAPGAVCVENACLYDEIFATSPSVDAAFGFDISFEYGRIAVGKPNFDPMDVLDWGKVELFERTAQQWVQTGAVVPQNPDTPSNGEVRGKDALFGTAVHLNGDDLFVGAPGRVARATIVAPGRRPVGGVYHYSFDGTGWQIQQILLPPEPNEASSEGSTCGSAVLLDGDTLYVGCPGGFYTFKGDLAPALPGRVEIYTRPSVTEPFAHVGTLLAPDSRESTRDMFGFQIARAESGLLVGAPTALNDNREPTGAVYFFDPAGDYELVSVISPSGLPKDIGFGFSLDVSMDAVVVGAPSFDVDDDGELDKRGSVFLIGDITEVDDSVPKRLLAPGVGSGVGDGFGYSVAIDGSKLLIGAPFFEGVGAAFANVLGSNGADTAIEIQPSSRVADNDTGFAVALEGEVGVVTAPGFDQDPGDGSGDIDGAGAVLVFPWSSLSP